MPTTLVVSFNPDLTDPRAQSREIGLLRLQDDAFLSFEWTVDILSMGLDPLTLDVMGFWPVYAQGLGERDASVCIKADAVKSLDEHFVHECARSSVFISRILHGVGL